MTVRKRVTIVNQLGLHARSASTFVKAASAFGASVNVINEHASANGKSIMSMLLLQATTGTEIEIEVSGTDEEPALDALVKLVENGFGED